MYNTLLGEGMRRLNLVRQSKLYTQARSIPRDDRNQAKHRSEIFRQARAAHGFSEYALSRYATEARRSWLGEHLDIHTTQKLAKRVYQAVSKVAFSKARKVRFKGKRGLRSVEGKGQESAIKWKGDHVAWSGLKLPIVKDALKDPVVAHGLSCPVKYVRLLRKTINGKDRFYAQLVCEGKPYQKPERIFGTELVGMDIGPSTIALVGETAASLEMFCEPVVRDRKAIRKHQRHIDRQRRANNPECYDEQGRAIKGKRPTKKSRRMKASEQKLVEMYRKEAEYRKSLHGQMANRILSMGSNINIEKVSYKAFQKLFGRSVGVRAPGMFVSMLRRKAESAGGQVFEFSVRTTALSQSCHCGEKHKKPLGQRVHECLCGTRMQRDLYSAYLARYVEDNVLQAAGAKESWPGAEPLLRAAWEQAIQPANGRCKPSSFGAYRSQSGSSGKESLPRHEAPDAVAKARAGESVAV
jgi:transposase